MKKFTILLLSVIFVTLIASYVQSTFADHLEPDIGVFKNENQVNVISSKDSKYEIYILVEIRNAQGQLLSVSEITRGKHIPHEITDYTFNEKFGEKEIITIDNIKYEKRQYIDRMEISQELSFLGIWTIQLCGDIVGHPDVCIPIFQARGMSTSWIIVQQNPLGHVNEKLFIKNQWTVLRDLN